MNATNTPNSNRLHIVVIGRANSGKSSLTNAITGQNTAITSQYSGTTTDPVSKAMEINGVGACAIIDTPGFDDNSNLGKKRVEKTITAIEKADVTLLVIDAEQAALSDFAIETVWIKRLKSKNTVIIPVINKVDLNIDTSLASQKVVELIGKEPIMASAKNQQGIEDILLSISKNLPEDYNLPNITGNLVGNGDLVLLVMPQDIQAPKGRLILPQVQTIRELLDKKCIVASCTTEMLQQTLDALAYSPKLIITDSQAFATVFRHKPHDSKLTSFSVLFAGYKGDTAYFAESAKTIDYLTENSKVLIAEACTHAPMTEDIGRVKIPNILRKRVGKNIKIDIVAGDDFPENLQTYDLIIHCGACMLNRKYVQNRILQAKQQKVPMTNYGIAIAHLNSILPHISF